MEKSCSIEKKRIVRGMEKSCSIEKKRIVRGKEKSCSIEKKRIVRGKENYYFFAQTLNIHWNVLSRRLFDVIFFQQVLLDLYTS
jgi:hypothetical protein